MINSVILVAIGGAVGAMVREFLVLGLGSWDSFPLGIAVANIGAAFVLGLAFGLHGRKVLTDAVHLLVGTGVMGGLSTFSELAFGAVELAQAGKITLAVVYVAVSLGFGYVALLLGLRAGKGRAQETRSL